MIRWICSSRLIDKVSIAQLGDGQGISALEDLLRQGRLRWFGHVKRLDDDSRQEKVMSHMVNGKYVVGPRSVGWITSRTI